MKNVASRLIYFGGLLLFAAFAINGWIGQTKTNIVLTESVVQRDDSIQHYKDQFDREHARRL